MSKRLGEILNCKYKTSSWHLNGFPDGSNISRSYNTGEKYSAGFPKIIFDSFVMKYFFRNQLIACEPHSFLRHQIRCSIISIANSRT